MRPIIFLNGPPGSGKDTLGIKLAQTYTGFEIAKFAWEVKERCHALYGRPDYPYDYFEECKDLPNEFFLGKTPREAYIAFSEMYMKPLHGEGVFGELLLKRMAGQLSYARGFVITDSGFESEAQALLKHYGVNNCLLVRIHGRGDFSKDSRSYLYLPIESVDIYNNSSRSDFLAYGAKRLDHILQSMLTGQWL
jgi:hypothetical protein